MRRFAGQAMATQKPVEPVAPPAPIQTVTSWITERNPETGLIEKKPRTVEERPAPAPEPPPPPNPMLSWLKMRGKGHKSFQ